MSQAAKLFHQPGSASETLHRRITPSDDQFEAQKERWNDLADFLRIRLAEKSGYSVKTWLQGSYKFHTQIRPWMIKAEFDIDLGVYFEWEGGPANGAIHPQALKKLTQAALVEYQEDEQNDATEVTKPKERCCRIRFAPDFHIDVPCYHLDPSRNARALATETKGWEKSDPKAIYTWFLACQDDVPRDQLRRLIRYLKMWAALRFAESERPSSILMTVLAADAFEQLGLATYILDDDDALEGIAKAIADRLDRDPEVPNPVNFREDLNRLEIDATVKLVGKLKALASIGEQARSSTDIATAAEIWSEAFDQFFPMPEDTEEGIRALAESTAIAKYVYMPDVSATASPRQNRHVEPVRGVNQLSPIPKDCEIRFEVINPAQLPAGCTLKWTVRNHGREAAGENDLGHVAGYGTSVIRNSAYNGDHTMDLTVLLHGQPIGRRRIEVKIRGAAIPPRNPKRRVYGRQL